LQAGKERLHTGKPYHHHQSTCSCVSSYVPIIHKNGTRVKWLQARAGSTIASPLPFKGRGLRRATARRVN
jgi:hypothetical protein